MEEDRKVVVLMIVRQKYIDFEIPQAPSTKYFLNAIITNQQAYIMTTSRTASQVVFLASDLAASGVPLSSEVFGNSNDGNNQ